MGYSLDTSAVSMFGRDSCSMSEDTNLSQTLKQCSCDTLLSQECVTENCEELAHDTFGVKI